MSLLLQKINKLFKVAFFIFHVELLILHWLTSHRSHECFVLKAYKSFVTKTYRDIMHGSIAFNREEDSRLAGKSGQSWSDVRECISLVCNPSLNLPILLHVPLVEHRKTVAAIRRVDYVAQLVFRAVSESPALLKQCISITNAHVRHT